jgi:hypothetical protein
MRPKHAKILALVAVVTAVVFFSSSCLLGYWIYVNRTDFVTHPATTFDPFILFLADLFGFLYSNCIAYAIALLTPIVAAVFLFRKGEVA